MLRDAGNVGSHVWRHPPPHPTHTHSSPSPPYPVRDTKDTSILWSKDNHENVSIFHILANLFILIGQSRVISNAYSEFLCFAL